MSRKPISQQQEFVLERGAAAARVRRRGPSQADRVLAMLQQQPGTWIAMPRLVAGSGAFAVHSRVAELRGRGHRIEHRNQWVDGACHSEYRLL